MFGHGGHPGHVTQIPRTNFRSLYPWRFHTKFGFDWSSALEEDVWYTGQMDDDGRTPGHGYTMSSLGEPSPKVS